MSGTGDWTAGATVVEGVEHSVRIEYWLSEGAGLVRV